MKNLEKYLIDFDTLKVGDKVWSIQEGYVKVEKLNFTSEYPIETKNEAYTKKGHLSSECKFPSLFKSNPFESISEYPKVMEVSDNENFIQSEIRVVFKEKQGKYIAWMNAKTLEESEYMLNTVSWKYAREIQPEKKKTRLTLEDIAKLANIDVKDLEIVK